MSRTAAWFGRRGSATARAAVLGLAALVCAVAAIAATPAAAQERLVGPGGTVTLEVRKGKVIQLERPAAGVFVADPAVADVQVQSPTLIYLFGRQAGATTIYAVDEQGDVLLRREVVVTHDLTRLRRAVESLLPEADIEVSSLDGTIVIEGEVATPVQAQELREVVGRFLGEGEALINRIRVAAPTQVSLRVRIAEVSRELTKELGFNWEALFEAGEFVFGFATGRDFIPLPRGDFLRAPTGANAVVGSFAGNNADVDVLIDALAAENLVTVLAEPNLVALSGETASFLAGGEFPIPISSDEDNVEIQFKEFGVSLAFTPTVLSPNRIGLRVRPEVSELSTSGAVTLNGLTIPALTTRRAETTVELGSGQTFAIAGLLSNETIAAVSELPGLADIPIVGALFRSTRFQRDETELVIIVTPYIVRPVDDPAAIALPQDGLRAPTDLERILGGQVYGVTAARLRGPAGFVLE